MNQPTRFDCEHYQKLVGRQIVAIHWDELEGYPIPVLVLSGHDCDGHAPTVTVLSDPEGNGPGHLDHRL